MRIPLAAGLILAATVTAASAVPLEGTWTGLYTCAQGATPAELYVQRAPSGGLDGRLRFGDGSPGRPIGCFAMLGTPDPANLRFVATHWFLQPPGFVFANLVGYVQGPIYAGTVLGMGCTDFQLVWHPPSPLPAECQ